MISTDKILLPKRKLYGLILNLGGAFIFLIESDFLKKPITDGIVLLALCFWLALFLISITRLYVSREGLEICLWCVPIRKIAESKISRIEIVKWHDVTHILFETGNCPEFKADGQNNSLWIFFLANMFRVVEYIPPDSQKDTLLITISTLFGANKIR